MSIFDTSNVSQQGGTNVSPTQDAVADNTTAIQGLASVVKGGLDFAAKSNELESKAQTQTAISGLAKEFQTLNDMVATGNLSPNQARARKNQLSLGAIQSGVDTKAVKGLLGIGFDQEDNFVTAQTRQENEGIAAAQKDGYIYPFMTREQQVNASNEYAESRQALHRLSMLQSEQTFKSGEITLDDKQRKQASQKELSAFAVSVNKNKKNQLTQITNDFNNSDQSPKALADALQSIAIARKEIESQVAQIGERADPAMMSAVTKGIFAQFDISERMLKGEISKEAADNFSANAVSFQKALALEDLTVQKLAALEQLFPTIALSAQRNIKAINFIAHNGVGYNTRPVDILVSPDEEAAQPGLKAQTKDYLEAVNDMGSKAANTKGQNPEQVQQSKEGVAKQLNGILNSMGNNTTPIPQASMDVVGFLADNRYLQASQFVGDQLIEPEFREQAMDALKVNGDLVIRTIARQLEVPSINGKSIINVADPVITAGPNGVRVVLRPKPSQRTTREDAQLRATLRETERHMSKLVGQYVAAGAHLQGHQNYENTFNEMFPALFGEERKVDEAK